MLGAFAFVALQEVSLRFTLYHGLILGVLLIAVVFLLPDGETGGGTAVMKRLVRRKARADRDRSPEPSI